MLSCNVLTFFFLSTLIVYSLFGYTLPTSLIDYKRHVLRGQLAKATEAFTSIPKEQHYRHDVFPLYYINS